MKDQLIRAYSGDRVNSLVDKEALQLNPEDLAQLNHTGELTIDLSTRLVAPGDRSARIDRIEPRPERTQIADNTGRAARLELTIEPADWCELRWQDHAYLFRYGLDREVSLARWGFNWDFGDPTQIRPVVASGDERALINVVGANDRNLRVEFRPGARTMLTLRVNAQPKKHGYDPAAWIVGLHRPQPGAWWLIDRLRPASLLKRCQRPCSRGSPRRLARSRHSPRRSWPQVGAKEWSVANAGERGATRVSAMRSPASGYRYRGATSQQRDRRNSGLASDCRSQVRNGAATPGWKNLPGARGQDDARLRTGRPQTPIRFRRA